MSIENHDDAQGAEVAPVAGNASAVPATSPLAGIARRLETAKSGQHLDLRVPGYRDELGIDLVVRYRPLSNAITGPLAEAAEKSKNSRRMIVLNAKALANACIGIFYLDADGKECAFSDDPDGPWPTFDRTVAALIEKPWVSPSTLVEDLFFTDDQIIATGTELQRWSSGEIAAREKDQAGN